MQVRQGHLYTDIGDCHIETGYPVKVECELLHVSRSAYNKWASGKFSRRTDKNYNNRGIQRKLGVLTPMEKYYLLLAA